MHRSEDIHESGRPAYPSRGPHSRDRYCRSFPFRLQDMAWNFSHSNSSQRYLKFLKPSVVCPMILLSRREQRRRPMETFTKLFGSLLVTVALQREFHVSLVAVRRPY